jgi:alpha-mannosidase
MQYYAGDGPIGGRNVSMILSQVVIALLANPARKFSVTEQAYFQIWYETQSSALQAQVQGLVASGQLNFINGGWSMHDEANPTFIEMLDNTAVGQRAIASNFGASALPNVTWQIDPFGHSAFQGLLSSAQAGYFGVMWAREMIDFKFGACAAKKLERVWTPSVSRPELATFQGIFVDAGYGTPGELSRCDYPGKPADCDVSKAAADAASAISGDIFSFRLPNVRGNDIILNFGDDFTTENAPAYFEYMDALIAAFNSDPQQRFHAFYSTPSIYMGAKLASLPTLPVYAAGPGGSADFFPYNDDPQGHNLVRGGRALASLGARCALPTDLARARPPSAFLAPFPCSSTSGRATSPRGQASSTLCA